MKLRNLLAILAVFLGIAISAHATVPAEITTSMTDISDLWDDLKTFILAVGTFVVLYRFFRKGIAKAR